MAVNQENKEKIRSIYSKLKGYLSQVPEGKSPSKRLFESSIWMQYNHTVNELNDLSNEDFSSYIIDSEIAKFPMQQGENPSYCKKEYVNLLLYRQKLNGLINHLHSQYFSDEQAPFSGMPSIVNIQAQQQNQAIHIQIILDVQSKIDKMLPKFEKGTKERTFLEKVRGSLSSISIKNVIGLISLLLNKAKEHGLSVDDLKNLFC